MHVGFEEKVTQMVYSQTTGRLSQERLFDNLTQYDDGNGTPTEVTDYTYDAFGRQVAVAKTTSAGTETRTWQYDSEGRLVRTETPEGVLSYAYDVYGRKTKTVVGELANPISETQYRYDSLGRLEYVDVIERDNVPVDSDPNTAGNQPETTRYRYDLQGNLDRSDLADGAVADYTYDSLNRLVKLVDYAPDSTPEDLSDNAKLAQYDYTLRADGRKTSATEKFWVDDNGQTTEITNQISWTYDEANRLVDEVFITDADDILGLQTGLLGTSRQWADYHDAFTYDLTGNRLKKTTDEGNDGTIDRTVDSTYDANDRLLTESDGTEVTSYAYDHTLQTQKSVVDNGVTRSTTQFAWDLMGRLSVAKVTTYTAGVASKVEKTTYGYDERGIRTSALAETDANADGTFETRVRTEFLNDKQNFTGYSQVLRETHYDADTGDILKVIDYAIGHDQISQTTTDYVNGQPGSQTTLFFATDGHGSVRLLLDFAGAIATVAGLQQIFHFDAYGTAIGFNPSQAATSYLYSGEQFDSRVDMQYLRARYYNPASGRFVGLDPYLGNMRDPQSLHKYLYTHADPVNGIDPSGELRGLLLLGGLLILGALLYVSYRDSRPLPGATATIPGGTQTAREAVIANFDIYEQELKSANPDLYAATGVKSIMDKLNSLLKYSSD